MSVYEEHAVLQASVNSERIFNVWQNRPSVFTRPQIFFNFGFCICIIFLFIFRNSINKADEKTLTVVFHAILSTKFSLDDVMKVVIRGDQPVFADDWNEGGVPVTTEG
jgi:hypothetical protein